MNRMPEKYTRRAVLKIGGAVTLAGTTAGIVKGESDRMKRVVTDRGPGGEVLSTTKVPKRWREAELGVEDAVSEAHQYLQNQDYEYVQSVGSHITSNQIAGRDSSRVSITINESASSSQEEELPDKLSDMQINTGPGVPEEITILREPDDMTPVDCEGFKTGSTFMAGWSVANPPSADERSRGTGGYPMHDDNGNTYLTTANHVLTDGSGTCNVGLDAYDTNDDYIGYPDTVQQDHDWAIIGLDSNSKPDSFSNELWYDGGKTAPVTGVKTDSGVRDLKGDTGEIRAQGCTTGYTYGTVVENNTFFIGGNNGCYAGDGNDIKTKGTSDKWVAEGDSGGPIFDFVNGDVIAITHAAVAQNKTGTHNCGLSDQYSKCHGYSFEAIVNNNPFEIGAN